MHEQLSRWVCRGVPCDTICGPCTLCGLATGEYPSWDGGEEVGDSLGTVGEGKFLHMAVIMIHYIDISIACFASLAVVSFYKMPT